MFGKTRKSLGVVGLSAAAMLLGGLMSLAAPAPAHAADDTIEFGWTAWVGAEFNTKLAKAIIENNWDYDVELSMSAIALQFQGVASGDIDGMLMAWLPDTHADYWQRYQDNLVDLGTISEGAKLGLVVPDYVPKDKLGSIEDLSKPEIRQKLDATITGIDPGAGIMRLAKKTVQAYDLDYEVQSSSGAATTAALGSAIAADRWLVVTGWTPHWMFGRWDLRFLDDPKGTMGGPQHVDIMVREGFKEDYPEVASFLSNMHIPLDTLQDYLYVAQQHDFDTAVNQ